MTDEDTKFDLHWPYGWDIVTPERRYEKVTLLATDISGPLPILAQGPAGDLWWVMADGSSFEGWRLVNRPDPTPPSAVTDAFTKIAQQKRPDEMCAAMTDEKPRHAPPLDPDKVWVQQPEGHYSTEDK